MDSFEWNKIFGAVLGTTLFVAALNLLVGGLMEPEKAAKPGMEVAVAEDHGSGPVSPPVEEPKPDWGTVMPVADVTAGEKIHQRCQQCHDFTKGGPDKIGPNLYGIVGNVHAHQTSFPYSPGMAAMKGKIWGYDELDAFIKNPKVAVPGTKMSFAGLSKQQDRVNLLAFLRTVSDSPMAMPAPNPAAAAPAAPADGAAEPPAGQLQATPPGEATPGATPPPGAATPATTPAAPPGDSTPATPAATAPAKPGH